MRLLLTTDAVGGVWNFTETLAWGLLTAGHVVALVCLGRAPSEAQTLTMDRLTAEFPETFVFVACDAPLEWMEENARAWQEGVDALMRVVETFAPDLIHSSQMCFGSLESGVPVLVTAHSDVLSWAECTLPGDGVEELARSASEEWLKTYRELVTRGVRAAAAVAAPTRWMAETLARLYALEQLPEVVANGILLHVPGFSPRRLQAVTAGRMWDQAKGLSILTEFKPPLPVCVAGESSTAAMPGLEWHGQLAHEDLLRLFAASSIYIVTSLYEPFGLAPVEAAVHGCAIVARDLASLREVWGESAIYFNSAASLEEILSRLVGDAELLRAAQERSRRHAARYTAAAMTDGYVALYKKLLSAVSPARAQGYLHA